MGWKTFFKAREWVQDVYIGGQEIYIGCDGRFSYIPGTSLYVQKFFCSQNSPPSLSCQSTQKAVYLKTWVGSCIRLQCKLQLKYQLLGGIFLLREWIGSFWAKWGSSPSVDLRLLAAWRRARYHRPASHFYPTLPWSCIRRVLDLWHGSLPSTPDRCWQVISMDDWQTSWIERI